MSTGTIDLTGDSPSPERDIVDKALVVETVNSIESIDRLRSTLLTLIRFLPGAAEMTGTTLLAMAKEPAAGPAGRAHGASRKRRSRFETCKNCGEEYDVEENDAWDEEEEDPPCRYHPRNLQIDYHSDTWADWDEDCHGTMDTQRHRMEYPDGFVYACCKETGNSEGCTMGNHVPKISNKRVA